MKVVLGVCGFGYGHSTRQRPILEGLLARGHDVVLVTNDQSFEVFSEQFPEVTNMRVRVPVIHATPDGIDFDATADDERNSSPEANAAFWRACGMVQARFGRPDVVISDYDQVSGQIAYLFDVPLVTLDQQSKFLGFQCPPIGDYTPYEHRMRLGYFFPKARVRIATSFFTVGYEPVPEYPVTVIPPILGHDVRGLVAEPEERHVTVYVSAASHVEQSVEELVEVFAGFPEHRFDVFVDTTVAEVPPNVTVRHTDRAAFVDSLRRSSAVVSTAGHNLVTEALYLRVPMFLLPFAHYEQQLNARIVTEEGVGTSAALLTPENLGHFLANLDGYRECQERSSRVYGRFDGDTVFLDLLESLLDGDRG